MSTPNVVSVYSAGHRLQMLQAATDSHHDRASRLDNCTIRYYASARRRALYVSVSVSCRQVMKRTANGPQNDGCDFAYIVMWLVRQIVTECEKRISFRFAVAVF